MGSKFDFIDAELARRRNAGQLRRVRTLEPVGDSGVRSEGRALVNFSSNDYLGLASHPLLKARAV